MHKFLRTIGFSLYEKDREIDKLLDKLCEDLSDVKRIQIDEESNLCEIRREVAPGMGIAIYERWTGMESFKECTITHI